MGRREYYFMADFFAGEEGAKLVSKKRTRTSADVRVERWNIDD